MGFSRSWPRSLDLPDLVLQLLPAKLQATGAPTQAAASHSQLRPQLTALNLGIQELGNLRIWDPSHTQKYQNKKARRPKCCKGLDSWGKKSRRHLGSFQVFFPVDQNKCKSLQTLCSFSLAGQWALVSWFGVMCLWGCAWASHHFER